MVEPKESKTNRHFYYSIAKSIVRFVGYGVMVVSGINGQAGRSAVGSCRSPRHHGGDLMSCM